MIRLLALAGLVVLLGGCVSMASIVKELAKDPATACVRIDVVYGVGTGHLEWQRTGIHEGTVALQCSREGLKLDSTAAPKP